MSATLATPQATGLWLAGHETISHKILGSTGLCVSQMGFGGYRIHHEAQGHAQALERALASGVNLIDTSANYTDGGSETLVGQVLAKLMGGGVLERGQVVLVGKAGYLQGSNYELSQRRKEEGRPFPDLVPYSDGLEHCIHPEFLRDQLERSLDRLGLEALDVFLLHNPEYFLTWAETKDVALDQAREEFAGRLRLAFEYLEGEVVQGRIGCYGVSSNSFTAPASAANFTSLTQMWELAQEINPQGHGFRVVQFPFNLLETSAATLVNQPGGQTLLEFAREKDLGVLVNRPLNAMCAETLLRLADPQPIAKPAPELVNELLGEMLDSENQLKQSLLPNLELTGEQRVQLYDHLSVAQVVLENWPKLKGIEHWRSLHGQYLLPRLNAAVGFLARSMKESVEGLKVLEGHLAKTGQAFKLVEAWHQARAGELAASVKQKALDLGLGQGDRPSLEAMAQRALCATPGVSCVLVGMRRPEYVDQVLAELAVDAQGLDMSQAWPELAKFSQELAAN